MDPLHILGFTIAHLVMLFVAIGFVLPRFFHPFIPHDKRGQGRIGFAPNVSVTVTDLSHDQSAERPAFGNDKVAVKA